MMNLDLYGGLLAEAGKTTAGQLALYVSIPLVLAIGLFGFGVSREAEGGKPWIKYLALLPLAFQVWQGWPYFEYARDPIAVQGGLIGGSSYYAYLGAFLGPIVMIVAVLVYGWFSGRRRDIDY